MDESILWSLHETGPFLVLVCGGREWSSSEQRRRMKKVIEGCLVDHPDMMILTGGCRGADKMARTIAFEKGIPYAEMPAQWDNYGKKSGPLRNRWMASLSPDLVLAFHDNIQDSRGTADMLGVVRGLGINYILTE